MCAIAGAVALYARGTARLVLSLIHIDNPEPADDPHTIHLPLLLLRRRHGAVCSGHSVLGVLGLVIINNHIIPPETGLAILEFTHVLLPLRRWRLRCALLGVAYLVLGLVSDKPVQISPKPTDKPRDSHMCCLHSAGGVALHALGVAYLVTGLVNNAP